ncbi:MAG: cytochrome-c peroxidase [Myxococcales bacterium]
MIPSKTLLRPWLCKSAFPPNRVLNRFATRFVSAAILLFVPCACGGVSGESEATSVSLEPLSHHPCGEDLFDTAFANTNGRACATCHVREEHTTLTPAHVNALLASAPSDPLFNRIDADDPLAAEPTYEHLKKGLVRVNLTLNDKMDLIDVDGNVVTPPDRKIAVWRAVPSIENTAITAPYQYDGRRATLQLQAQGAVNDHSQGGLVAQEDLDAIAEFQKEQFTSGRARSVARRLAHGTPIEDIERPELSMKLTPAQARGRDVYNVACEACHGGATTLQIVNREVHDLAFLQLKPDGNVLYDTSVQPPKPVLRPQPNNEFLNVGFGNISYLGQIFGDFFGPRFNASVPLPQYRYRFYTDATRTVPIADLPPVPVTVSGSPSDLQAAVDANGAPIVGPNLLPQQFSTDPGRAATTGEPQDFEAFDVPALRGIAHTGPYFHDNSAETLRDVVDLYSRFILQFFGPLNLPLVNPAEEGSIFPESLSPQQKQDLLEFLEIL